MSFDLERAKEEGCVFVSGDNQWEAQILCDDYQGEYILARTRCIDKANEILVTAERNGFIGVVQVLKNKPQKLEVRIWKIKATGEIFAMSAEMAAPYNSVLIKTIEVEI